MTFFFLTLQPMLKIILANARKKIKLLFMKIKLSQSNFYKLLNLLKIGFNTTENKSIIQANFKSP